MSTSPQFDGASADERDRDGEAARPAVTSSTPPVLGGLYPPKLWRTADTQALVAVAAGVLVTTGIAALALGALGPPVVATTVVAAVTTLVLIAHRRLAWTLEQERRQAQAIAALHALLPLRAPLPPMAGWAATPELAAVVAGEILTRRPRRVVEAGSGVSTVVAAYCLEKVGHGELIALDHDPDYAAQTRAELARHDLGDRARVVHAPLEPVPVAGEGWSWYDRSGLDPMSENAPPDAGPAPPEVAPAEAAPAEAAPAAPPIDLLIIDGPPRASRPQARYPALPLLWPRLSGEAVIILDDARRADERAIVDRWLRAYPELRLELIDNVKGIAVLRRGAGGAGEGHG